MQSVIMVLCRQVLHLSLAGGLMKSLTPGKDIRINDKFFIGGPLTMRGFNLKGCGPHDSGNYFIILFHCHIQPCDIDHIDAFLHEKAIICLCLLGILKAWRGVCTGRHTFNIFYLDLFGLRSFFLFGEICSV